MGIVTSIKFGFTCDACGERSDVIAQSRTPKYHSPSSIRFDGKNYFYQIGDVMEWHDTVELQADWPGDYAFVSNLSRDEGSPIYVIERCWGRCLACRASYHFYFYIKDRQIMRLIGHEPGDLNDLSIVRLDPSG